MATAALYSFKALRGSAELETSAPHHLVLRLTVLVLPTDRNCVPCDEDGVRHDDEVRRLVVLQPELIFEVLTFAFGLPWPLEEAGRRLS